MRSAEGANQTLRPWRPRDLLFCLGVSLWCAAFNLTKAVHIDDTVSLEIAQGIANDPLHPLSHLIFWDQQTPRPAGELNQPHLFFALLAPLARSEHVELWSHVLVALLGTALVLLFHRLCLRVSAPSPRTLTLLLFCGPGFLPGQNVMNEVPLLLAWVACLWFALPCAGNEAEGERRWWLAALCAGVACLIKYSALVLVPWLALELVLQKKVRALRVLLVPVLLLTAWSLFNLLDGGRPHLFGRRLELLSRPASGAVADLLDRCLFLWPISFGACAPIVLALLPGWLQDPSMRRRTAWALAFGAGFPLGHAAVALAAPSLLGLQAPEVAAARGLFLAFGAAALVATVRRPASPLEGALSRHLWLTSAFLLAVAPFIAVRHSLLILPGWLLLAAGPRALLPVFRPRLMAAGTALTVALGALVAIADWRAADLYRTQATELAQLLHGRDPEARLWFTGHWGWQWYARKAGLSAYLPGQSAAAPGDFLVEPSLVHRQEVGPAERARLQPIDTVELEPGPLDWLRTVGEDGGYYNASAVAPFGPRAHPRERFVLSRFGPVAAQPKAGMPRAERGGKP